ncbi:MAG: flagellar hook-basal body complex protein FliE [Betaproteobacteria bacterium]|jgi:flagellar hook-basal body complex protein FliE
MVRANYESSVASLMSQIESHKNRMQSLRLEDQDTSKTSVGRLNSVDFAKFTKEALDSVHESQEASKLVREAFERGENVPLTDVVLQMQKSSLAFEATLQVRNKLLKAYEDIMNMPV